MNRFRISVWDSALLTSVTALFISSVTQLLQYGAAGLCCPNKLKRHIGGDATKIIVLIGFSL